jgi:hypothetical protein
MGPVLLNCTGSGRIGFGILLALAAPSCRCGKAAPHEAAEASAPIFDAAPPGGTDLRGVVCRGRNPCRVVKEVLAGTGPRVLVTVALSDADPDAGDEDVPCARVESWLVGKQGPLYVREQLLVEECTRKPAADWPSELKVNGDVVRYELDGQDVPSTWVGMTWAEIGLAPPRLIADGASYWNRMQRCPQETVTRREAGFSENVAWRMAARCSDDSESCTAEGALAYLAVPRVKLPAAYEGGGWRSTELGSCAAAIDGSKDHGFVAFGKTGGPADASMRVVLSEGRVLYIDLRDDRFTSSEQWAKADHLEIWGGSSAATYMDGCDAPADKPTQWGIAVADAAVFVGSRGTHERPLPTAERAESGGVVHLRVQLPPVAPADPLEALTVAYSDSDDGKAQKSIIATSKVVFGRRETLGRITGVVGATCMMKTGRLIAVRTRPDPSKRLWPTTSE